MNELQGRVAIVTGASMGIGAAIAQALARAGCHVVLAARSAQRITELAERIHREWGVLALAVPTDIADPGQIEELVQRCEDELGGVDILVNNAGLGIYGDVAEMEAADLRYVFDVNFFGAVQAIQAVVPAMRRRGGGTIVNISSIASTIPMPLGGGYSATKSALEAASVAARAELSRDRIRVIVVRPGITATDFSNHSRVAVASLHSSESQSPFPGVSPERVAQRTVQAIKRGERDVYITWFDRLSVGIAAAFPWLLDLALRQVATYRRYRFERGRARKSGTRLRVLRLWPALLVSAIAGGLLAWRITRRQR